MLELKLFGTGQARYFGRPIHGFPHHQACLLFCYLLVNKGNLLHRERLAAVFWGDSPTFTARKNLRNTLWRLRQTLESVGVEISQYLHITEENVAFIDSGPYWLDTEYFTAITSRYASLKGDELSAEQAAELAKAVALYRGDLLEGVYEDWFLYDRERLRLAYLDALYKLILYHKTDGSHEQGIDYGERMLALDPTREKVHRQLMVLHWLAGNPYAALAQYKRCAQILQEEMGIQPMEETRFLYERMARNQFTSEDKQPLSIASLPVNMKLARATPDVEAALQRLHHLQRTINKMNEEVGLVEQMLYETLANHQH
jgi:DNA-binding SARP family transcriptional activator